MESKHRPYRSVIGPSRTRDGGSSEKILLVAKPWRGGLWKYLKLALDERALCPVEWVPTYPVAPRERLDFLRDRRRWRDRLIEKLAESRYTVAVFVNHVRGFQRLPFHPGNVLWMTDVPKVNAADLRPYRRVFLSDPGRASRVPELDGDGRFAGVLPFGMLPSFHVPVEGPSPGSGLCFVGNADAKRDRHLRSLLDAGLPVNVFGNYFGRLQNPLVRSHCLRFRPPVPNEQMGHVYARHGGAVNIHANVVRGGTNMRTFECAGYGVPQVVEWRPGLDDLFEPEREILTYRQPAELPARADRLLRDPAAARRMAARARERVLGEHTYHHRIDTLLEPGALRPDPPPS